MIDRKLIKACLMSQGAYREVEEYVLRDELTPQAKQWWDLIVAWYSKDPEALQVDPEIIRERGKRTFDGKYADDLLAWYDDLPAVPSPKNVTQEIIELKLFHARNKLAQLSANPETKPDQLTEQMDLVKELMYATSLDASREEDFWLPSLEYVFESLDPKNKIRIAPLRLNTATDGGVSGGDHVVIFGRTEVGKTLFTVNMVSRFIRDNVKVVYVGNEDKIQVVTNRIMSNLTNMTKHEMNADRKRAIAIARKKGMTPDVFQIVRATPGTMYKVEKYIEEKEPQVIVLDQFRNIAGQGDNLTANMNYNAIKIRSILAKHDVVGISIAQAYAGEHDKVKVWLEEDDIDSSRTGLPAQADLMLGLGADKEMINTGVRAVSVCKNKLGGVHEGFMVRFDTLHSRVTS